LSLILALGFSSLLYFPSCNDKEPADPEDHFTKLIWSCDNCNFTNSEVEENLKLAAKGLFGTLNEHQDIKGVLETQIGGNIGTLFTEFGEIAINAVASNLNQRLPDTMQARLDDFNQINLDTCILRTFKNNQIPLCCNAFFIRIPDFLSQNTSLPIIVFPILEKIAAVPQEDVFGYFDNGGALDSVTMGDFVDQDLDELFYQWVVGRIPDCDADWKQPGCDNDGICEPLFGETLENCLDCQNLAKTLTGKGSLYLWSVQSLTDWKRKNSPSYVPDKKYQEWHYNGKYEIGFQYAVFNTDENEVEYQFVIDDTDPTLPYKQEHDIVKEFTSWGNCEVPRCKDRWIGSGTKCNNGTSTVEVFGQSKLLSSTFHPTIDEVYFLLYEKDWEFTNPENVGYDFGVYMNRGIGEKRRPYSHQYNTSGGVQDWSAFHAAVSGTTTTHSGGTNQTTVSNSGDDIWFVDNDQALWTAMGQIGGKDAYQYYNTLDGEWAIQLVYIED
jgi:hypothetical protein